MCSHLHRYFQRLAECDKHIDNILNNASTYAKNKRQNAEYVYIVVRRRFIKTKNENLKSKMSQMLSKISQRYEDEHFLICVQTWTCFDVKKQMRSNFE